MTDMSIILCDEENENVQVKVRAEIVHGYLEISGHDFGLAVENLFETDDYEYFYRFDRANTERLLALLSDGETSVENTLLSRFSGMDGCKALREFCDANEIKYQFYSYP